MLSQTDLGNKISVKLDIEGIFKNLFICAWGFFVSFFRIFFHGHSRLTGHQGKGGDHLLFHSTTLPSAHEHSDNYFVTLHVRWLSHISNRTACIYQTATRWDLPPYRVTIWVIDDVMLIFVCLLVDLIQVFCYIY